MAIVGTAFVRLRVIGDKLKGDIASATKKAVNDSAPELGKAGEDAGKTLGDGVTKGTETEARKGLGKVADDIGSQLGNRMGEIMGTSLRKHVAIGIRNAVNSGRGEIDKVQTFFKPVSDKFEKFFGEKSKHFEGIFKNAMISGISLAAIALPSALAFLGAAVGGLAATVVTALASLGPSIAGAALAGLAAFSALKISVGLFGLALKTKDDQLTAFKKNLTGLKDSVGFQIQIGLLSGMNSAIGTVQRSLPALSGALKITGQAGGDVVKSVAQAFTTAPMLNRINTILKNNVSAIYGFGSGASALAQSFVILLSHLGPVITYLATGADELGQWVLAMIKGQEASGNLDGFIHRMFNTFVFFTGGLVDFAKGIINIFHAAWDASGGMVGTFVRVGAAFKTWTGDPANQERMTNFFRKMRDITREILPVFEKLGAATLHGLEGTHVDKFSKALDTLVGLGKPLADMFKQIQASAGDKLQTVLVNFADVITQLAKSGVLGTMTTALANMFAVISMILKIPGVGPLLGFAAGLLAMGKTAKLLWMVLGPVLEILWAVVEVVGGALVAAFGWIPVLIGLVVVALIWFFTQTKIGKAIVAAVWAFIKNAISVAVDGIVAAWDWMVAAFKAAAAWVSQVAQSIWSAVSTAFNAVVSAVQTALNAVWGVITGVWNAVWGFIQPILQGIWNFISSVFNNIVLIITTILNIIWQIWIRVWPLLALPIRVLYGVILLIWGYIQQGIGIAVDWIVSKVTAAWNWLVGITTTAMAWLSGIISGAWNAIYGWVSGVVSAITGWVSARWNWLVGAISGAMNAVWGWITRIWNQIWGFISPIIARIVGWITSRWDAVLTKVRSVMNTVSGVISGVWNSITTFINTTMTKIGTLVSSGWDMIGRAGNAVLNGMKAAVNFMIGGINGVIEGINWAIDTANKLPGPDIPRIPEIPKLARGGVVSPGGGGTLALIAEAGRPERVEPLDPNGLSQRDHAMINLLTGGGSGDKAPNVNVYIGTKELTGLVDYVVEDRESRLANRVLTGTR